MTCIRLAYPWLARLFPTLSISIPKVVARQNGAVATSETWGKNGYVGPWPRCGQSESECRHVRIDIEMVRKDEPLKVTDLESGGPADEAGKQSSSSKEPAKSTSVFDRLAYGGGGGQRSRARKVPDEELPNRPSVKSKTANKSNAQQQQPTSGSTSVFDRLSSGERLYRTTTQTGRKPAGRRATEQPEIKQVASIPIQQTEAVDTETAGTPEQTAVVDVFNELDEEEPSSAVPDISLIQQPVTTRPIRPVLKKSARLLRPPAANSQRRKYWVNIINFPKNWKKRKRQNICNYQVARHRKEVILRQPNT